MTAVDKSTMVQISLPRWSGKIGLKTKAIIPNNIPHGVFPNLNEKNDKVPDRAQVVTLNRMKYP